MISLNNRLRSVVLALTLLVTGQVSAFAWPTMPVMPAWAPSKQQAAIVFAAVCYVRLQTKGTSFNYKKSDWEADVKDLMSSFNLFDTELYGKIVAMFDKWCIGRKLSILDATIRTREEDGTVVAVKDKRLKSTAFGALGLFDAYVICWIDKLMTISSNFGKISGSYDSWSGIPKKEKTSDYQIIADGLNNMANSVNNLTANLNK